MKKLFWMAGLMMLAACSNQEMPTDGLPEVETGRTVVAKATLPGGESRLALTEVDGKTIKVDWKESGETFSVMTGTPVEDLVTFTQTTGDEFTGTIPSDWTGPYYAFYPELEKDEEGSYLSVDGFDAVTTVSADKVPFDLTFQTGKLEDLSPLMRAVSQDGENYAFEHLTAIVKLTLTGMEDVKGKQVVGVTLAGVTSQGVIDCTTEVDELEVTSYSESALSGMNINADDLVVSEDGSVSVYLCLPPVSKETQLIIAAVVIDGDLNSASEEDMYQYVNMDVALTKDLEAGKYYRMTREVTLFDMDAEPEPQYYTAGTPEELMEFAEASNQNFFGYPMRLTLTNDIDMSGQTWTPINYINEMYPIIIDGGGYTISNLTINGGADDNDEWAFIRYLYIGSSVANLHLKDINVTSATSSGGIVGRLETDARIVGCSVSGEVKGNYAAGIVAVNNGGIIGGCINAATVEAVGNDYASGGISAENNGEIFGCINTGNVTGGMYCGAIVRYNNTSVSDCYWSGNMAAGIGNQPESDATNKVEDWTGFNFSGLNSLLIKIGSEFVLDTETNLPKLQKISSDPGI